MTKHTHIFKSGIIAPAEGKTRRAIKTDTLAVLDAPEAETGAADTYLERMAAQRKVWKEEDARRFYNPDADKDANGIWNAYMWGTYNAELQKERWHYIGQRRKKPLRRKPMTINRLCAGIRQSLGIPKDRPIKLISEQDDNVRKRRGDVWEHIPPKHFETLASWEPPEEALALRELPKQRVTRHKKDRSPQLAGSPKLASTGRVVGFNFKTRYVAWGRSKKDGWVYLGPCMEKTRRSSRTEILHRFPIYPDPVIVEVRTLTYSMRSRLRDGRVRPGQTKIAPPAQAGAR